MNELDTRLDRWVQAGLISLETASALRTYERTRAPDEAPVAATVAATAPVTTGPATEPGPATAPARSLAVLGEVVGYLGAVLTVTALTFVVSQTWPNLSTAGRIGLVTTLTVVVAGAGMLASRAPKPPAQRLASVLLFATVALTGWLTWVIADGPARLDDDSVAIPITGAMAVVAAAIYAWRRRGLAQVAALATLVGLATALMRPWESDTGADWMGPVWAAIGLAWLALGVARALAPPAVALVTGGLLTVLGLQVTRVEDLRGWVLALAVALAVAMIAAAVTRRGLATLLVPGGIGLLVAMPQLLEHVVGDTLATWLGVLLSGVALVLLAVWMVRGRKDPSGPAPH